MPASTLSRSTSFEIDVSDVKTPAGKPHHLAQRLSSSGDSLNKKGKGGGGHAARKAALLEARQKALAQSLARVRDIAHRHAVKVHAQIESKKSALEFKMAKSEARRQVLMTVPRSKLLFPESMSEREIRVQLEQAARRIQIWWRGIKVSRVARMFLKLNLSLASAGQMPFPALVKKGQSEAVLKGVGRLLVRAKRLSLEPVENWQAPTKVFMSAYMMVLHSSEVMPEIGPKEQVLIESAETMLMDFEAWLAGAQSPSVASLGRTFLASWIEYYENFDAWKSGNNQGLIKDLVKHFLDLEKLWISVKDQEDAEGEWMPRIRDQQKQIQSRLAKMGGSEAMDLLAVERSKALDEFKSLSPSSESRPVTLTNTSVDVYQTMALPRRDSVTKSRTSSATTRSTGSSSTANGESSSKETPAADAKIMETLQSMWTNQKIAHEMIMDPDFKMKRSDAKSLEGQVSAMARKAFFDSIREDFEKGILVNHVPSLLGDIREILISMLPEKSKVGLEIKEVLDIEHIKQQITNSAFDVKKALEYVTQKMLQLCAPIRDASIRSIATETDLTNAFSRILGILEDMRFDLMNFQLESVKPHLKAQAVEYETLKFDEALASGSISLDKTEAWLSKSVNDLKEVQSARNPDNLDHPDLKVRYESAYHDALLGLIFATQPLEESNMAETLALDIDRIFSMQNEAQAIAIVASLCMLSKNIVPELRGNESAVKKLKETLFVLLQARDTTVENLSAHIISTINETLASTRRPTTVSEEQEKIIATMVGKTLSFSDAVYSLISRRMQAALRHQLEKGTFKKESLVSHGLDTVGKELEGLSLKLALLAKHNKEVYVKHYDRILTSLIH